MDLSEFRDLMQPISLDHSVNENTYLLCLSPKMRITAYYVSETVSYDIVIQETCHSFVAEDDLTLLGILSQVSFVLNKWIRRTEADIELAKAIVMTGIDNSIVPILVKDGFVRKGHIYNKGNLNIFIFVDKINVHEVYGHNDRRVSIPHKAVISGQYLDIIKEQFRGSST